MKSLSGECRRQIVDTLVGFYGIDHTSEINTDIQEPGRKISFMSKHQKKKQKKQKKSFDIQIEFSKAYDLHIQGKADKAEELYRHIIRIDPQHSDALHLLGVIALEGHEYDNALSLIKRAIRSYPHAAPYYNNLGLVYKEMGRIDEALNAYHKALEIDPDYSEVHNNLGILLKDKGHMTEAISCFESATRINTGFSTAYYNLGTVLCDQGYIPATIVAYKKALSLNPGFASAHSNLLYTYHFSDAISPEDIYREHLAWADAHAQALAPDPIVFDCQKDPERKLNIGYVSPDFCTHSVAFFIEEVLACHNRKTVEIFCYSNTPQADDFTQRFKELSDHWREIQNLSDQDAADLIRKDKIDILVDLAGHTRNNRILIFAHKPAPVQVTWLGYPNTTGLSAMDFRLTDSVADPVGESDQLHSEKLYRMPHGFLCYRPAGEFYPVTKLPLFTTSVVTFGSFNNNSKISPSVIETWARILKQVPDSRLKLKARSFSDFGTRKYILECFESHGIPSERIWFEGYRVTLKEHFLLYGTIDIALDTFPYNGTTTTCEALWMGVPVIALSGNSHVSRVGNSILTQVGLTDLIAESPDDYVSRAVALARNPELLATVRSELRERMIDSPLLDANGFTSDLEYAFRTMWQAWIKSTSTGISTLEKNGEKKCPLYETNLEALRIHHPGIETLLNEQAPFDMEIRVSPTSDIPNLFIEQAPGVYSPVYLESNPLDGLQGILNTLHGIKGKVVCLMGDSLFLHTEAVLERVGDYNLVVLFEAVPAILNKVMNTVNISAVLAHPNIRLAVGSLADPYSIFHKEDDTLFTSNGGIFIDFPAAMSFSHAWYNEKHKQWDSYLNSRRVSKRTAAHAGARFFKNSLGNVMALAESEPLASLKNTFRGRPALIVASGPSLSKNIEQISQWKDKALIIAADSALAPLARHHIKPHMIVSVDYNDFTYEKLSPYTDLLKDVALIHLPAVTSKILNYIEFSERYYTFADQGMMSFFKMILDGDLDALNDIQSVIHLALKTAQVAGCDPIIFTGLDLAYAGEQDHVEGTLLHWNNNHTTAPEDVMIEGALGGTVLSRKEFVGMLEICERMMAQVPDRHYIDATEGGARKKGTQVMSLKQAGEIWLTKTIGMPEWTNRPPKDDVLFMLSGKLEKIMKDAKQSLDLLKTYETNRGVLDRYIEKRGNVQGLPSSLPQNIRKTVQTMDTISRTLDQNPLLLSLQSLFAQYVNDYQDLELEARKTSGNDDPGQRFMAGLKQQAFVQTTRQNVLTDLSDMMDSEFNRIQSLMDAERHARQHPENADLTFDLAQLYFNHDLIIKAAAYLKKLPSGPEPEMVQGFVHVLTGRVEQGRDLLSRVSQQRPELKTKVDDFISTMIDGYLADDGPQSYRDIQINKALCLSPGDPRAFSAKQARLLDQAEQQIRDGRVLDALNNLQEENTSWPFDHDVLLALYACLLFDQDQVEAGCDFLKRSVEIKYKGSEREKRIKRWWKEDRTLKPFEPDKGWGKELVERAREEAWARRAVQEFLYMDFDRYRDKAIKKTLSSKKRDDLGSTLETWVCVKDILPEWFYFKSLYELALGNRLDAVSWIDKSLAMEQAGVEFYYGKIYLEYMKGIIHVHQGYLEDGIPIICDCAKTGAIFMKVAASLLLLKTGKYNDAHILFDQICKAENLSDIEKGISRACMNGDLESEFNSLKSLKFFSAYFLIMGKYHLETGHPKGFMNCLMAAISHDPEGIMGLENHWVTAHVQSLWSKTEHEIDTLLFQGSVSDAEDLLGEWETAKSVFLDYDVVMAKIIEKKENREIALSFLNERAGETRDNAHIRAHCARLLFDSGRFEDAAEMLGQAIALDPEFATLWEDMGDALFERNDIAKALNCYEMCLSVLPDRLDVLRKIGDLYLRMGKRESAEMAYATVLQYIPDHVLAARGLDELRKD